METRRRPLRGIVATGMSEGSEWVAWVGPARAGDAGSIERLEEYFAPFIHAVILSRVGHHLAGKLVKPALAAAISRLAALPNDSNFGHLVLHSAREQAAAASK